MKKARARKKKYKLETVINERQNQKSRETEFSIHASRFSNVTHYNKLKWETHLENKKGINSSDNRPLKPHPRLTHSHPLPHYPFIRVNVFLLFGVDSIT